MATESAVDIRTVGPDVPFKVDIQTQEIIDLSIKYLDLKPVTNAVSFERENIPTVDGLFSEEIFGKTVDERKRTYGYIELNTTIIHPFIYEILTKLQQNISKCCAGEGCWKVTDKGDLIRLKDDDPEANPENTGMDWFVKNYPKIKWKRNNSRERNERIDTLETLEPKDIFLTKFLVQPVFYRDVEGGNDSGPKKIPPINKEYINLIRYAKSLSQKTIMFIGNTAKYQIQLTTLKIHRYFRQLIEKSDGFFNLYVVGRSPDYGHRSVISCMVLDQFDTPDEVPIDVNHCGIPLAEVCVTLFPFIVRWVSNYLTEQFESAGKHIQVINNKGEVISAEMINPMDDYTTDLIKKRIDKYIDNYESRFEPVYVTLKREGSDELVKQPLVFAGRPFDPKNPNAEGSAPIAHRPFTWTDLLYIAAVEVSSDKSTWVTRYPLTTYTGIFPCMIHVMSTIKTEPIKLRVNGIEREYPYYPVIDTDATPEQVSVAFNDTLNMDNSFLEAIKGDYDGDQVSHRALFSNEANEETANIITSKKHYLDCQGKLTRTLGNEGILGLYAMTQFYPNKAKPASLAAVNEIINTNYKNIGVKKLTEWFGYTSDIETKKIKKPKYINYDTFTLTAGQYTNKKEIETTLGLIAFNKICIEPYVMEILPDGYWNIPLSDKGYQMLFDQVATALKYDRISIDKLWPFLKAVQFYGYKATTIFASSMTTASILPDKKIMEKRNEFFKNNPNPTLEEVTSLEDELSAMLQKKIDDDTSRSLFASGAKAKVNDQLKNINTMIGPVFNPATNQYDVIKSNYVEGFAKHEIPMAGNMVVSASYPKAVGTADAGYVTKQFYALFGATVVDKDGTDCHTKSYLNLTYTENTWKSLEGQNVMINETEYVTVTDQNYKQFINKPIKVRSPMCCTGKKICSVCAGRRPYEMEMENIGINFALVPNTFLNAGMKKFHTSKVKLSSVKNDQLFI